MTSTPAHPAPVRHRVSDLCGDELVGLIAASIVNSMSSLFRWALLGSIGAVGIKTSLKRILDVGSQAIILIFAETIFIVAFVLLGELLR